MFTGQREAGADPQGTGDLRFRADVGSLGVPRPPLVAGSGPDPFWPLAALFRDTHMTLVSGSSNRAGNA
jgi:hypothetical protein